MQPKKLVIAMRRGASPIPLRKISGMKVMTVINGALRAAERREANFNLSK
jgi:hypothetical protein